MELIVRVIGLLMLIGGFCLFFQLQSDASGEPMNGTKIFALMLAIIGGSVMVFLRMGWRYDGFSGRIRQLLHGVMSLSAAIGGMAMFMLTAAGAFERWWKPYGWQNLSFAGFALAGAVSFYLAMNRWDTSI